MADTNTTDISDVEIGLPLGWEEVSEFFKEVNIYIYVIPITIFIMCIFYWWRWRKKRQLRQEQAQAQAQVNAEQGQNYQQNLSGPMGFFHRIFVGTAPPPVNPQTIQMATPYQASTDPFNRPPMSTYPGPGQTTQYSQPPLSVFDRPPPPPYPGLGNTTGL